MTRWCLTVIFLILPSVSEAAIVINEIAWMGSSDSANDEWIELVNTGDRQSLEGWSLRDGMNLDIALTGTVSAGQYAVLERTDDTSAPGTAFLLYAGSLANTGATLTLRNANGTIVDQVAGGENWVQTGGDNATKETAQLTNGGWVTAPATPGTANVIIASSPDDDPTEATSVGASSVEKSEPTVELQLPDYTLRVSLEAPTRTYVHQPVSLALEPAGIGTLDYSLAYRWNFGDGNTATGKATTHVYQYPGTYVVVAEAAYARHQAQVRTEITVLPVMFSMTRNERGDVQIHNDAKYEVDLSGYVVQGLDGFLLPAHTYLLPGATLTIPAARLKAEQSDLVALIDGAKTVVAVSDRRESRNGEVQKPADIAVASATPPLAQAPLSVPDVALAAAAVSNPVRTVLPATSVASTATPLTAAASDSGTPLPLQTLAYLGLAGVVALGFLVVAASRTKPEGAV